MHLDNTKMMRAYLSLWKLLDLQRPDHHWLELTSVSDEELKREISQWVRQELPWAGDKEQELKQDIQIALESLEATPESGRELDQLRNSFQDKALAFAVGQKPTEKDELRQLQQPVSKPIVTLDTKGREFLAKATAVATGGDATESKEKIGCLVVLEGKTDQREYILTGKLCVIGKSEEASVKLKGWFAPKVAAVISRHEDRYDIVPSDIAGTAKVNSEVLSAPRELREGDMIQIGSVKMQFNC